MTHTHSFARNGYPRSWPYRALSELQETRKRAEEERLNFAARLYIEAVDNSPYHQFDLAALGFEFSLAQIEVRAIEAA